LRLLVTLQLDPARMTLISGFIDAYLRLNEEEESQFSEQIGRIRPVEQRGQVMQIVTSWMERGIEQGLTQGRVEGLTQGIEQGLTQGLQQGLTQGIEQGRVEGQRTEALALLLRQLTHRFKSLSNEMQQQIAQLSLAQLETLSVEFLDFANVGDLQDWLAQNQ
jgi:flagellar biosynthesis/type III secretory pathway protein FliH